MAKSNKKKLIDWDEIEKDRSSLNDKGRRFDSSGPVPLGRSYDQELLYVDRDLGLYELTDIFYSNYRYHQYYEFVSSEHINVQNGTMERSEMTLSRFEAFRRIEACRLGCAPYKASDQQAGHKPNYNNGMLSMVLKYLSLPFKSIIGNKDYVGIVADRSLYNKLELSPKEQEQTRLLDAQEPMIARNKEISNALSDRYNKVLKISHDVQKSLEPLPRTFPQNAFCAILHPTDDTLESRYLEALDLVTEPQCGWDTTDWTHFFVITKLSAAEAVKHIRDESPFWNTDALKWALESSYDRDCLLDGSHYALNQNHSDQTFQENFMVKSFYNNKSRREQSVHSYYGNMLVVEAYYLNKEGKIDKAIFFPSNDFQGIADSEKSIRDIFNKSGATPANSTAEYKRKLNKLSKAGVLFYSPDIAEHFRDILTVIPYDRTEPSLERQRGPGHELLPAIQMLNRLDSSILNLAQIMGIPMIQDLNQGQDAQKMEDLLLHLNGHLQNIGERKLVELPWGTDLKGMISVRMMIHQEIMARLFLGGLDGMEQYTDGRGGSIAEWRITRDANVLKQDAITFSKGLKDFYTRNYRRVLKICNDETDRKENILVNKLFYEPLTELDGIDKEFLKIKDEDVLPDTGLPYWMTLDAVRSGGSHFGPAELVVYTDIKALIGDSLSPVETRRLNRMILQNITSSQDADDILGTVDTEGFFDEDQAYEARLETVALLGSVDRGSLNFEQVPIRAGKDDHVAHLRNEHNPKAQEYIDLINNSILESEDMDFESEEHLDTRSNLILKLSAIAAHSSLHQAQLERYGNKNQDINQLKEETNAILQTAEGLLANLQSDLRSLQQMRMEKELKLRNMSPENEAEKAKQQTELMKVQAQMKVDQEKLMLANKIADNDIRKHNDKQLSVARDREFNRQKALTDSKIKLVDIETKAMTAREKKKEDAKKPKASSGSKT